MAFLFPSSPATGATYVGPNGIIYTYNGVAWEGSVVPPVITAATTTSSPTGNVAAVNVQAAITELDNEKLDLTGGTLTGPLVLAADPTINLGAATKQYVDTAIAAIPGAPTTASGLTNVPAGNIVATNVQAAIDELDTEKVSRAGDTMTGFLTLHADPTSALQAATKQYVDSVSTYTPSGNIAATTVGAAIAELDSEKLAIAGGTMTGLLVLSADPTAALGAATKQYVDAASNFTPSGNIAATTLSGAIAELDSEKAPIASPALTGTPTAPTPAANDNSTNIATTAYVQTELGALTAADIDNVAAGNIAATDVQGAINELDSEKVAKAGDSMTGFLTLHADPTSNLHAATKQYVDNISTFTPSGNIAATTLSGAIAELDSEKLALAGGTMTGALTLSGAPTANLHAATKLYVDSLTLDSLSDVIATAPAANDVLQWNGSNWVPAAVGGGGSTVASGITTTPAGNLAATDVQAALNELDSEKLALAGGTMTGLLVLSADPTANLGAATKQYVDGKVAKAGDTMSGALNMADNLINRPMLQDYAVKGSIIGNTTGARTFDLTVANFFSATLNQASTFTFSNPPASGEYGSFVMELTNGGAFAITWPASVDWPGGTAPTLTAAGKDQLVFTTRDGGTTWLGFVAGKDIK